MFYITHPCWQSLVYVTDSDKHSSLFQFKLIIAIKSFISHTPDDKAWCLCLTVTNIIAYYISKLITAVKRFISQAADDKAGCMWLTVTNTLSDYNTKLITAIKCFIYQTPGDKAWCMWQTLTYYDSKLITAI